MRFLILSHFSYLIKSLGETSLILLSVVLPSVALKIILRHYFWSYINAGTSPLLRASVLPFSSFLRASVLPPSAATLPCVQPPTFVRFLTFLYCLLSLLYFSYFAVTYFTYFVLTIFSSETHALSHTVFHFSYLMKPLGETSLILLSVVLPSVAL